MCLIVIGEAAKQLMRESPEVVDAAGDLDWPQYGAHAGSNCARL